MTTDHTLLLPAKRAADVPCLQNYHSKASAAALWGQAGAAKQEKRSWKCKQYRVGVLKRKSGSPINGVQEHPYGSRIHKVATGDAVRDIQRHEGHERQGGSVPARHTSHRGKDRFTLSRRSFGPLPRTCQSGVPSTAYRDEDVDSAEELGT